MNNLPIYLLVGDEPQGPHEPEEILDRLDDNTLNEDVWASVEGMPQWRSVREAVVWSHGALLGDIKDVVLQAVNRMVEKGTDCREARADIAKRKNRLGDSDFSDSVGCILRANAALLRGHKEYNSGSSGWDPDVREAFPAMELTPFGQIKFRRNWETAWEYAGGILYDERMIARKDDVIWLALSDFGFRFSPYSIDPMMGTLDVSFDEAEAFGLVTLHDRIGFEPCKPFELIGIL